MANRYKLFVTFFIASVLFYVAPVAAAPMEATISLGRDPEPPMCVANPGGVIDITWSIEHATTPDYVYYELEDPTRTTILDQQTYPGTTGVNVNRQWALPPGAVDGKYWIRVEYWSIEAGNEANAEVTFYGCTKTSEICARAFEDIDSDNDCSEDGSPIPDWWICLQTPLGDALCKQTGIDGRVCWSSLPLGDYTVYEPSLGGMIPVGSTSLEVTLGVDPVEVSFCNKNVTTAAKARTWGMIKSMYR
jgi:hypothetical protein